MFKQINKDSYPTIKNFVNQYQYRVAVNTILDMNTKGLVFADDTDNQTVALVWDTLSQIFVFGQINDINEFNKAFKNLVDDVISPKLIKDGEGGVSVSFFDEKYWDTFTDKVIEDKFLHRNNDWLGIFDKSSYLKLRKSSKPLPEGYELFKINREILMADENMSLKEMILDRWQEIDDFLQKGFGFCVLRKSKVISCCFSGFVSDNRHYEISIKTFDPEERKKGLATLCSFAYIDYCIENEFTPHWETDYKNIASQNMGMKVGFVDFSIENNFIFLFNRADHFLWRINNLFEDKDIDLDLIKSAVPKVFENNLQKPTLGFIYHVAGKLAENGICDQAILLLDEYLKIDKNKLKAIKENDSFKLLHNSLEWKELLMKYDN